MELRKRLESLPIVSRADVEAKEVGVETCLKMDAAGVSQTARRPRDVRDQVGTLGADRTAVPGVCRMRRAGGERGPCRVGRAPTRTNPDGPPAVPAECPNDRDSPAATKSCRSSERTGLGLRFGHKSNCSSVTLRAETRNWMHEHRTYAQSPHSLKVDANASALAMIRYGCLFWTASSSGKTMSA